MNTRRTLITVLMVGATVLPASAQESGIAPDGNAQSTMLCRLTQTNLKKACTNYLVCLRSPNPGVVESAIGHIARMKTSVQAEDFCDLKSELQAMAVSGPAPAIRYKAYLVTQLLDHPRWFAEECAQRYTRSEDLLEAIARRLQKSLVG